MFWWQQGGDRVREAAKSAFHSAGRAMLEEEQCVSSQEGEPAPKGTQEQLMAETIQAAPCCFHRVLPKNDVGRSTI